MSYTLRKNSRGFTLIELLVTIAIIGVLSAVVLVSISSVRNKARDSKVKAEMHQIRVALAAYAADNGGYPGPDPGTSDPQHPNIWCIGASDCKVADTLFSNSTNDWEDFDIVGLAPDAPRLEYSTKNLAAALFPQFADNDVFKDSFNRENKGYLYVSCENPVNRRCPLSPSAVDGSDKAYLIYPQTAEMKAMQVGTFEEVTCNQNLFPQCEAEVQPCNEWVYSEWSACMAGTKTRLVTGKLPANCSGNPPMEAVLSMSCTMPNTCEGTLNCSGDQTSCLLVQGCEWVDGIGACGGSPNGSQYCNDSDQANCEYKPGCLWGGGSPESCVGAPSVSCSSRLDSSACGEINGCSWQNAYCTGSYETVASCSDFNGDQSACTSHGCSYPGNNGNCSALNESSCSAVLGCSPSYFDCSTLQSEWECSSHTGCSYDYEGGVCGGVLYDGCTGGYDDGSCFGDYSSSNSCSGFDQSTCQATYGCTYNDASCQGTSTCTGGTVSNCSATGCSYIPPVNDVCSGSPDCIGTASTCEHVVGCVWTPGVNGCQIRYGHSCGDFSGTSEGTCTLGGYDYSVGTYKLTNCIWSQ